MTTPARRRWASGRHSRTAGVLRTTLVAAIVAALVAGSSSLVVGGTAAASSDPPSPSSWPDNALVTARLSGAPNAIRFFGPDRSQTSLALALALRGAGGFPFTTPDPSSAQTGGLAASSGWWGLDTCPRSIIVVAGDVAADALAASALSDPTGNSSEPFLERTAAADPLFDPIGGFARVDTDAAPILVTRSTRQGATTLTPAARLAAQDLRSGGCTTARQAIVIGGAAAVPVEVDAELISLGYNEVFRVAGVNRYATAAAVARSLGTAGIPAGVSACVQPDASAGPLEMRFIANSVIEYRSSPTDCEVLGRTVVVADGITGADALAAGWWTGFAQVPVVLHDGTSSLPAATAAFLATESVGSVIILGGRARIPESVSTEIAALTGTVPIRIAGADRTATSLEMAAAFGGWFPDLPATATAGSMLCLAASSGDGAAAQGWPDALSGGPWCAAATAAAGGARAPQRALTPTNGAEPQLTAAVAPGRAATPIILVPYGAVGLPATVTAWLASTFDGAESWCSSNAVDPDCLAPGFAVVFGGTAAIGNSVMAAVSSMVAGAPATSTIATPVLGEPFVTGLDLSPVFTAPGSVGICLVRGSYVNARWLTAFDAGSVVGSTDVFTTDRYVTDADGVTRSPGIGAPVCVPLTVTSGTAGIRAVSGAGRVSPTTTLATAVSARLSISSAIASVKPTTATGLPASNTTTAGGASARSFVTTFTDSPPTLNRFGTTTPITAAELSFTLTRGNSAPTTPTVVTGRLTLTTASGTVTGAITAEAVVVDEVWQLRGRVRVDGGIGAGAATGGFTASWVPSEEINDESISWRFDAAR